MRSLYPAPALALALALLLAGSAHAQRFESSAFSGRWYKGNTHTHTTNSDGDTPPDSVALWYRAHGYNFLVLSDHNVFTDPRQLSRLTDSAFILIPGEELTTRFQGKPVHINGLQIPGLIDTVSARTLVAHIQANIDNIRKVRGVPHINHPNFEWSLDPRTLAQVRNDKLIEIFNGHPLVNNLGGGGSPGMEEVWDYLLTGGKRIYGIAVDDAHHFKQWGFDFANPGKGWVVVKANALEPNELMRALEAGSFYASSGVLLADIIVTADALEIRIAPDRSFRYRTTFYGNRGQVLGRSTDLVARYRLRRGSKLTYVRAKVEDSAGRAAWVQPVFVSR